VGATLGILDAVDKEKIRNFISAGGDINVRDDNGHTALHRAAAIHYLVDGVRNLLEVGADPNLPVSPGSSKRTIDVVRHNLEAHRRGSTAQDRSKVQELEEIERLLGASKTHGARASNTVPHGSGRVTLLKRFFPGILRRNS
jgi:ankyrin repeat protein